MTVIFLFQFDPDEEFDRDAYRTDLDSRTECIDASALIKSSMN